MPRKNTLPSEFTAWIDDLPEDIRSTVREKLEGSPAYGRMAGLQKLATQSAQEAAQAKKYAEQWDNFAQSNPILSPQVWQHVGPLLSQYKPDELVRRLQPVGNTNTPSPSPQQVTEGLQGATEEMERIRDLYRAKELTWEQAEQALKPLARRVEQFQDIAQDYSRFRNEFVPTFTAGLESKFQQSERAMMSRLADMQRTQAQITRYAQQYPDRDVEEILTHAQESQLPFMDAARSLYGEDDQQAFIQRHTEPLVAKNKELEAKLQAFEQRSASMGNGDPGEGSMGRPSAMTVYTRLSRRNPPDNQPPTRQVARSEREVREQTIDVLRNFENRA